MVIGKRDANTIELIWGRDHFRQSRKSAQQIIRLSRYSRNLVFFVYPLDLVDFKDK
jgi:hypothetical protein